MPISLTSPNNFSSLTLQNLTDITNIKTVDNLIFPSQELELDQDFMKDLILNSKNVIDYWTEQELVMKQLSFILKKANLKGDSYDTFAERALSANVDGYDFGGYVDFVIAKGKYEPTKPYFFIQEFKKSRNQSGDPLAQLLGEMLVAQELNQNTVIHGVYIVGKLWSFITMNGKEFSQEESLDSTNFADLSQIFYRLNGIKQYIEEQIKLN